MSMITNDWKDALSDEFKKDYYKKLYTFVKDETYVADGKGGFIQVTAANKFAADNTYGVVTETPDGNTSTNANKLKKAKTK